MNPKYLKLLATTFFASGVWDLIAGIMYLFFIGNGRQIDNPEVHPFYTIFLGSFFICFAYLQFLSALNIQRYLFIIGCLLIGRVFYVIQLYVFIVYEIGFPTTFWFTGVIDGVFIVLYLYFSFRSGATLSDLFIPKMK